MMRLFSTSLKRSREILDVAATATEQEIKAAFYKQAKEVHPDSSALTNKVEAAKQFRELTEARDQLLNNLNSTEVPSFSYDELRKKNEHWEKKEFFSQEQTKQHQAERKERERKRQETWDQHKQSQAKDPVHETKLTLTTFVIAALIVFGLGTIISRKKPAAPPKPRTYFSYERGLTDAFTNLKSEPLKREIPIELYEGRFEPHFVFIQMSFDDLGASTLFKCSACNQILTKGYLGEHAHKVRALPQLKGKS